MLSGGIYLWQMITKAKSLNHICIAGFIFTCFDKKIILNKMFLKLLSIFKNEINLVLILVIKTQSHFCRKPFSVLAVSTN